MIHLSRPEKAAWVSLLSTLVIGGYFLVSWLGLAAPLDFYTREMAHLVRNVILLGVAAELVNAWLLRGRTGVAETDERDRLVDLRATRIAYWTLLAGVLGLLGHTVVYEGLSEAAGGTLGVPHNPAVLAYGMLFLLIAHHLVHQVAALVLYRRGW